MQYLLVLIDKL